MLSRLLLPCLLAFFAAGLAIPAHAQEGRRGPPSGDGGMQRGGRGGPPGGGTQRADDMLATQLAMLHDALRLDAGQERLWMIYTDKLQAFLSDMQRPATASSHIDAPHLVENRIAPLRNRLAALEQISDAAERLYRQLDARQRGVADEMLAATVPLLPDRIETSGPGRGRGGPGGPGESSPPSGSTDCEAPRDNSRRG